MAIKITPTKANLIKSKSRLAFSTKGYNLLDKKRTVLIQEIMKLMDQSKALEEKIQKTFDEAYLALRQVNVSMGLSHVQEFALSIPPEQPFALRTQSVMGVDIPEIVFSKEKKAMVLPSGFYENNPALDIAIDRFNRVKELSYKLAQIEGTAFKLSQEIKKTQKSANALEKIQIPKLTGQVKYISESIEENEREENFRTKKVKANNE